jgi:tetratricopeptide (TPR) repeat protein
LRPLRRFNRTRRFFNKEIRMFGFIHTLVIAIMMGATAAPIFEPGRDEDWPALYSRVQVLDQAGKGDEAFVRARYSIGVAERQYGRMNPCTATCLMKIAEFHRARDEPAHAIPLYERTIAIWERAYGPDYAELSSCWNNMALCLEALGRQGEAEPLYLRAIAIDEKTGATNQVSLAISLINLGDLYENRGEYEKAAAHYQRAVALYQEALGPTQPELADHLRRLADLHRAYG